MSWPGRTWEGAERRAGRQAAAHTTLARQTAGKVLAHFYGGEAGGARCPCTSCFGNAQAMMGTEGKGWAWVGVLAGPAQQGVSPRGAELQGLGSATACWQGQGSTISPWGSRPYTLPSPPWGVEAETCAPRLWAQCCPSQAITCPQGVGGLGSHRGLQGTCVCWGVGGQKPDLRGKGVEATVSQVVNALLLLNQASLSRLEGIWRAKAPAPLLLSHHFARRYCPTLKQ